MLASLQKVAVIVSNPAEATQRKDRPISVAKLTLDNQTRFQMGSRCRQVALFERHLTQPYQQRRLDAPLTRPPRKCDPLLQAGARPSSAPSWRAMPPRFERTRAIA